MSFHGPDFSGVFPFLIGVGVVIGLVVAGVIWLLV